MMQKFSLYSNKYMKELRPYKIIITITELFDFLQEMLQVTTYIIAIDIAVI